MSSACEGEVRAERRVIWTTVAGILEASGIESFTYARAGELCRSLDSSLSPIYIRPAIRTSDSALAHRNSDLTKKCRRPYSIPSNCTTSALFPLRGVLAISVTVPLPTLEVGNSFQEVNSAKIGPKPLGDNDLRIGDLPEQEIRDPHLTGGPH